MSEAALLSEDSFLALVRRGATREALDLGVREHGPAIGRLCMALLGTQSEAEEAAQETFLAAHRAIADYRGEGSVRGWLCAIARRICARRWETRNLGQQRLRVIAGGARAHDSGPELELERGRRAAKVREALQQLRPTEREAVVLRYQAGLSYREVGLACGIDEATARKRVSRALGRLRPLLKDEV